ncbi:MAG: hypothetical protein PHZ00_03625 [Candidatus Peribacteraceae bacterium]|nr:hypothetical protein [Candidatus Peribacteraceae bacterium]
MRRHPVLLRLLLIGTLFFVSAESAWAQTGGQIIRNAAYDLIARFSPLILIVMIMTVIILAFTLLLSHDDAGLSKAKSTLIATLIGGMIITVILMLSGGSFSGAIPRQSFIELFFTGENSTNAGNYTSVLKSSNANAVGLQAEGVASWLATMAAVVGILIIIITALRAFLSFGDEASYANVRKSILHIIIGLIIIGGAVLLRRAFYVPTLVIDGGGSITETVSITFPGGDPEGNPDTLIELIKDKVMIVLAVMTIVAVAILIYAGLRMVISFGREEDFSAAKSLMLRVIVGLFIILLSFTLMWIVASLFG